ncbi:MAG: prepilin-type cleavage/methylation domain-containing protein [Sulfuricurvum sp.]|jgi:hypothetical protein|uniref:prepilin-type cleavage/methylation domain-containing protein n=1 Tax=Sulfuricurvum sp. TaxID=2025608 RepID=UPI0027331196|nr:prepilin-type cleavage/methylation domain-containing protein [Sulfuricurvum sp.]MDP2849944.1 prepilin-type cleavage/methylation domain-containing protein [Sulfuricurvum sp.]
MTQPYNGMRKGISLVEMTIAVILFALLSTVAMLYYKNLFNIDLTSKKARIAALMDQGYQLSGAYDVFQAQMGYSPSLTDLSEFNATNVLILRRLPNDIREMTSVGWELNTTTPVGRPAFLFPIDLNGTTYNSLGDDDLYCAIYNHEINKTVELNTSNHAVDYGDMVTNYARYGDSFCFSESNGTTGYKHWIAVVK